MSTPTRKGWCPSLFEPMPSGDGLLTRVKPPRAVLTATAARALAVAAAGFGNGAIELTGRANLQVRGLSHDGAAPFAAAIVAAGLADPDAATERRRSVIHPPLADANFQLATEVEATLARDPALASLPAKFCIAVDDCGLLPLGQTVADVTVIRTETGALILPAGSTRAAPVLAAEAVDAVTRTALSFLHLRRDAASPPPRRMRVLLDLIGTEELFTAAGLTPSVPASSHAAVEAIGWLPTPGSVTDNSGPGDGDAGNSGAGNSGREDGGIGGRDMGVIGLGALSGRMDAAIVTALADLAERYGNGEIRLTPWRTVLLPGIAACDRTAVQAAARTLGLIADPGDRRRRIVTCTGQPGCAAASVDVRADSAMLWHLDLPAPVHVSGCAKGCAHHGVAPITLVGEHGRYAIIRDGDTSATPSVRDLTMSQVIEALGDGR